MIACQRSTNPLSTSHGYNTTQQYTVINSVPVVSYTLRSKESRDESPRSVAQSALHPLKEWSVTNYRGPVFEDNTFDNTTLWSRHRYHCFSDSKRAKPLLSSQTFPGELACHTSLIKLRRQCDIDMWIQVERQDEATGEWMETIDHESWLELQYEFEDLQLCRSPSSSKKDYEASSETTDRRTRRNPRYSFNLALQTIPEACVAF